MRMACTKIIELYKLKGEVKEQEINLFELTSLLKAAMNYSGIA